MAVHDVMNDLPSGPSLWAVSSIELHIVKSRHGRGQLGWEGSECVDEISSSSEVYGL
jgi:hypothetical protein